MQLGRTQMGFLRSLMLLVGCWLGGWQALVEKIGWGVVSGCPSPLSDSLCRFRLFRLVFYYFAVYVLWVVHRGFGQVYTDCFVRCDALIQVG